MLIPARMSVLKSTEDTAQLDKRWSWLSVPSLTEDGQKERVFFSESERTATRNSVLRKTLSVMKEEERHFQIQENLNDLLIAH